jgi:hypothetical protein
MLSKDIFYIKDINKIIMNYKKDLDIILIKRQVKEKKILQKKIKKRQTLAFLEHIIRNIKI